MAPSLWTLAASGAVRTSRPFRERAEVSPSGTRVAFLPARTRPDPVERERVRVADVETGDEIATVPGPATVRALHWAREDRLIILRDASGGLHVAAVDAPSGELVAEGFLPGRPPQPDAIEQRYSIEQTPDGRTLCLAARVASRKDYGDAWLLDSETLALRRRADDVFGPDSLPRVHPAGERLLYAAYEFDDEVDPSSSRVRRCWVSLDEGEEWRAAEGQVYRVRPAWRFLSRQDGPDDLRWCGPDTVLAIAWAVGQQSRFNARDPAGGPGVRVEWFRYDFAQKVLLDKGVLSDGPFHDVALSPDGRRVATLHVARSDKAPGVRMDLALHSVPTSAPPASFTRGFPDHVPTRWEPPAVAWSADGERVAVACPGIVAMASCDGAMRVFALPRESAGAWKSTVALRGRWIVEQRHGEHALRLTDTAALR